MPGIKRQVSSPLILILSVLLLVIFSFSLSMAQAEEEAKEFFNEGLRMQQDGKLEGALLAYGKCISRDASYIDAYINKGTVHFKLKQFDEALKSFKTATEKDNSNVNAFANLGRVQYTLKKYAEAEVSFNKAIEISPDKDLYKELGKVYYKKKDHKQVIATFDKCHEVGGGDYLTYYMKGKAHNSLGEKGKAITALNKSVEFKASNYNALSTLGQVYLSQEKFKSASTAFKRAMKASPKKYRAAYNYAVAVESQNPENYDTNIKNWEHFISIAKNNAKAKRDVSVAREHVKDLKEASENASLQ